MEIRGYPIAKQIYTELVQKIKIIKRNNNSPTLAVILIGNNPISMAYIKQKIKHAEKIGAQIVLYNFANLTALSVLEKKIKELNNDTSVNGILIQQPLPEKSSININQLLSYIVQSKEIDGLTPNSSYKFPLVSAVFKILDVIREKKCVSKDLNQWLKEQKIVIIGKGETGGGTIIQDFINTNIPFTVVDSKTKNREMILKKADIIISAVGKENIVQANEIKKGVILIGIGQHKEKDGKIHGDYKEEEVKDIASMYTPTPGGVGVVNVACLLSNLIEASQNQTNKVQQK